MNVFEKIAEIQDRIKVNKDKNNTFAGFKFRTIQDILAECKPVFKEFKLFVTFENMFVDNDMLLLNLVIRDLESKDPKQCEFVLTGNIKIDWSKGKMDDCQKILSAKTFLKKSLLEDALLIVEEADPDSHDNTNMQSNKQNSTQTQNNQTTRSVDDSKKTEDGKKQDDKKKDEKKKDEKKVNLKQLKMMFTVMNAKGISETSLKKSIKEKYLIESSKELTLSQFDSVMNFLNGLPDKEAEKEKTSA